MRTLSRRDAGGVDSREVVVPRRYATRALPDGASAQISAVQRAAVRRRQIVLVLAAADAAAAGPGRDCTRSAALDLPAAVRAARWRSWRRCPWAGAAPTAASSPHGGPAPRQRGGSTGAAAERDPGRATPCSTCPRSPGRGAGARAPVRPVRRRDLGARAGRGACRSPPSTPPSTTLSPSGCGTRSRSRCRRTCWPRGPAVGPRHRPDQAGRLDVRPPRRGRARRDGRPERPALGARSPVASRPNALGTGSSPARSWSSACAPSATDRRRAAQVRVATRPCYPRHPVWGCGAVR